MAKLTQCDRILRHMKDYGSIDPMVAIKEYGCMRLASRIADLKDMGHDIVSERTKGKNRYGEATSYCTYRLVNLDSFYDRYTPLMNKVAIDLMERKVKAFQRISDEGKGTNQCNFLGADKPIIGNCNK